MLPVVSGLLGAGLPVLGFDFITQPVAEQFIHNPYILWILGGLFLFVGTLGGIIIKMGTLMFQWRREIDKEHSDNAIEIAKFAAVQKDIERLFKLYDDLSARVSHVRESRLLERRYKRDDMEDDN